MYVRTYVLYLNKVMMESYTCTYVYHTVKLNTYFFCSISMCVCVCMCVYACTFVHMPVLVFAHLHSYVHSYSLHPP